MDAPRQRSRVGSSLPARPLGLNLAGARVCFERTCMKSVSYAWRYLDQISILRPFMLDAFRLFLERRRSLLLDLSDR